MATETGRMLLRRRLAIIGIAVVALIVIYYALAVLLGTPVAESPQVIVHRGGRTYQPENTMAAFSQAVDDGVDWLEFDVQMSNDGVLVVIHDETVDRTTNGAGAVANLTLSDLMALDAGNGQHIPTFAEVIEFAAKAGVRILPEAKSPRLYPGIEAAMIDEIAAAGYTERTVVQSFDAGALETFHRLDPNLSLCALYGQGDLSIDAVQPGDAQFVCPMAEMVMINPAMVRAAHAEGRQVFAWFGRLENATAMRALIDLGVDGLIVDDQRAMTEVLGR